MTVDETRRIRRARGRRRTIGAVVFIYGVSGLLLVAGLALMLARPIDEIGNLSVSLDEQRGRLLTSLNRTTETLRSASVAGRSFDTSLTRGRDSATQAATLARDAAVTMDGLAQAMGVQILGTQPLANLAVGFTQSAGQLRALGDDLDGVGTALGEGTGSLTATVDDLDALADSVDELSESLESTDRLTLDSGTVGALRLAFLGLAAWLAGLALGCVLAGAVLWRSANRIVAH